MRRRLFALLWIAALAAPSVPAAEVRYRVTFDATWSAQSHPQSFPSNAHFSCPVGVVHDDNVSFWDVGALASAGIELMAETGSATTIAVEFDAARSQGRVHGETFYADFIFSPGATSTEFTATAGHSRFTMVTMIAPSPDWFAGTSGLELRPNGYWRDGFVVDLVVFDSGTDSGPTFTSANNDTNPADPITLIVTPPLATGGYAPPIGTYTFTILDVDGRPPYADADADGLTNLREAELGTDPTLEDTDADGVFDPADNCALLANSPQLDADADAVGDVCDNCPATRNTTQVDLDADGSGDLCDLDDGSLWFEALSRTAQAWQADTPYTTFNLYRGDLQVLRGGGDYTQDPAGANATRLCGLGLASAGDAFLPGTGNVAFYLVTGVSGAMENSLGEDSEGAPRPHAYACP